MTAEIKRAARQGNQDVVKTLAKQLVQLRNHEAKLMGFTANMSSMQMQMTVRCGAPAPPAGGSCTCSPCHLRRAWLRQRPWAQLWLRPLAC